MDGTGYVAIDTCLTEAMCTEALKTRGCPPPFCVPGQIVCDGEGRGICNTDGRSTTKLDTCPYPTPLCSLGKCVECIGNMTSCAGTTPQTCVNEAWSKHTACSGEVADTCMGSACLDARVARWPMPKPFSVGPRFSVPSAKVALDMTTGLAWQRGVSTVDVDASTDAYRSYCETLVIDGEAGWHTPSPVELLSLLDFDRAQAPRLDATVFFDTPSDGLVGRWTGSAFPRVDMSTGTLTLENVTGAAYRVRCVKSHRPLPASQRFVTKTDVIDDNYTRIAWSKVDGDVVGTYAEVTAACQALFMRLPTAQELYTLVDPTAAGAPYVDAATFAGMTAGVYWTQSSEIGGTGALGVDFAQAHGPIAAHAKDEIHAARCMVSNAP